MSLPTLSLQTRPAACCRGKRDQLLHAIREHSDLPKSSYTLPKHLPEASFGDIETPAVPAIVAELMHEIPDLLLFNIAEHPDGTACSLTFRNNGAQMLDLLEDVFSDAAPARTPDTLTVVQDGVRLVFADARLEDALIWRYFALLAGAAPKIAQLQQHVNVIHAAAGLLDRHQTLSVWLILAFLHARHPKTDLSALRCPHATDPLVLSYKDRPLAFCDCPACIAGATRFVAQHPVEFDCDFLSFVLLAAWDAPHALFGPKPPAPHETGLPCIVSPFSGTNLLRGIAPADVDALRDAYATELFGFYHAQPSCADRTVVFPDVTTETVVNDFVKLTQRYGHVEILMNNAAFLQRRVDRRRRGCLVFLRFEDAHAARSFIAAQRRPDEPPPCLPFPDGIFDRPLNGYLRFDNDGDFLF